MKVAKTIISIASFLSLFSFVLATIPLGFTFEFLVIVQVFWVGFVNMLIFHLGKDDTHILFTLYTLFQVLVYGIWNIIFGESLNEVRSSAFMVATSTFIMIGFILEIINRKI